MRSFIEPILDKNGPNSSVMRTHEACGFKILCRLLGCCLNHKCYRIPNHTLSHKCFFSMCITCSVCRINKCCHINDIPVCIRVASSRLHGFFLPIKASVLKTLMLTQTGVSIIEMCPHWALQEKENNK